MRPSSKQWIEIVKLISTFIIGIITTLAVQSCTASMSIQKNNTNSVQKTEQSASSFVDSVKLDINR